MLLPVGTMTNSTCPPTESQATGERGSGTGRAHDCVMCSLTVPAVGWGGVAGQEGCLEEVASELNTD